MTLFRTEGVVTQVINFQEQDRIATVFTQDHGFVKFIIKEQQQAKRGTLSPLTRVELVYVKGKSDLLKAREFSTLNHFLNLRNSLATLEAAGEILKALQKSQLPNTSSPQLYQLLLFYFESLPHALSVKTFIASFYLKILRLEGQFGTFSSFTKEEMESLQTLAFSRSIQQLAALEIPLDLYKKTKTLFDSIFSLESIGRSC
jgi:DNA repair protein RecO